MTSDRYDVVERVDVLDDVSGLADRRVAVIGCGALGSAVAAHLVRVGVGAVRVVDRDVVEVRNLAHQVLYTQRDADEARLKAEAAAEHLRAVNPGCSVEAVVADCASGNARRLVADCDLIVDGVDNMETKLLLNDVAVATGTPLLYAGCAGTEGSVMAVVPGRTHCLRCVWPDPPASADRRTCQTRGVLPGTVAAIAALQATESLKVLLDLDALCGLVRLDIWQAVTRRVPLPAYRPDECPACGARDFVYLRGETATTARALCGDDTVLLVTPQPADLNRIQERHRDNATLQAGPESIRLTLDGCRILVFASGRTLIHGSGGVNRARALHARHLQG
ncbi:ThiF family adenylyltransferase [Actinokineospora auranticolor]|uniref:Adenylyltransferase/sulfurtransferase n=1 Tax=Actinokineospora auranticolor TaxID=155976 RepID=A0A2S6H143_9PSEU|nr:ThiF family adenylyltransferase [Actinokineospora auranticolor]PPK71195.1 adenylyltransferase/sulfurtransferase [Actinokineospora auranticolor]